MLHKKRLSCLIPALFIAAASSPAHADENQFGYISGAETLPKGASEAYAWLTRRGDKERGEYTAHDLKLEYGYGVTSRLTAGAALLAQSIDTSGIVIDGYLPGAEKYGMKPSGLGVKAKYNFLSPAKDDIGLSAQFELLHTRLDPHSGKDKSKTTGELTLQLQKFFLDDQLVVIANTGLEATYAKRKGLTAAEQASADAGIQALSGDPAATFEWPTEPEMEIGLMAGGGVSYRFAPNLYAGVETRYETEFETEVGQERWSWFAGPTLHYGGKQWWATLTWFEQLKGGKEKYIGQTADLHLIEKTTHEVRFKLGYNF